MYKGYIVLDQAEKIFKPHEILNLNVNWNAMYQVRNNHLQLKIQKISSDFNVHEDRQKGTHNPDDHISLRDLEAWLLRGNMMALYLSTGIAVRQKGQKNSGKFHLLKLPA